MKIESYAIRMDSVGAKNSESTRKFKVGYTSDGKTPQSSTYERNFSDTLSSMEEEDEKKDRTHQKGRLDNNSPWAGVMNKRIDNLGSVHDRKQMPMVRDIQSVRQQFVLYLWRLFFGDEKADKMAKRYGIEDMSAASDSFRSAAGNGNSLFQTIRLSGVQEEYYCETQNVSFTSSGNLTTSDGRKIEFKLDIEMSSRFEQYYRTEGEQVISMCDPLVLNLAGDIADLSDQKFMFDIDCDGKEDEISLLEGGNGFLSLDKNEDGIINDGSELFGTKTGNGFSELAGYDTDANGWIDENDDIFDRLKVWYKDDEGNDKLLDLKSAGVGAIYLGNAMTDFELRSADSFEVSGAIRRAGIFVYENAMIGSMVHMDINRGQSTA